ncbi:enhancer of yellow 2 transcription factor [Anopheles bellator]|uniref:enhancer of yellow 2 transcription factor n=1 Tax=Anopheles cruzii TaxID=68878 RepID=UPI0022EC6238|nr:enhancer of yellow 2 transcription factor [Anopheles cruzii]XP_058067377.1 enhancer of yellow 2 transcription factor [Anopheles bellator]
MYSKSVDQMTILCGDRTKLKDLLRKRLIESGWFDQVQLLCRKAITESELSSVDAVVQHVTPQARAMVPDIVKKELLFKIRSILSEQEKHQIDV